MDTVQARSIYLPKLGGTLRIGTIAVPPGWAGSGEIGESTTYAGAEKSLAEVSRFVMGVPPGHMMSFSRWREINQAVRNSVGNPRFVSELRDSIAGQDHEKRNKFESDIEDVRGLLAQSAQRIPDLQSYTACVLRNITLPGRLPSDTRLGALLGISGYAGGGSIVRSLYHDLARWDEITLSLWTGVTSATLNENILPSIKSTFDDILLLEIPFSGTPRIKSLTVAQAVNHVRALGVFVLKSAAVAAAGSLVLEPDHHGVLTAMTVAAGGVATAVVFFGFAAILPELERALARGFRTWVGNAG